MSQNRSTAVMQRRRVVAPNSLDYFPTPPWATRALCEFLGSIGQDMQVQRCWEPACGELHMVHPLAEYFGIVRASDVHDYGGNVVIDFVWDASSDAAADWIISNPPFRLAEEFIKNALGVARIGTAMLLRGAFLEGQERAHSLFLKNPPTYVLQFSERVVMLEGRLIRAGAIDPFAQKEGTTASSATSYIWLIWDKAAEDKPTELHWIAPCRARLERPGDYPVYASASPLPDDGLFAEVGA